MLFYDGTTYGLSAEVAKDLLERGVVVVDAPSDMYALSLEHAIEEVEPFATVLERSDAPRPPRSGGCGSVASAYSEESSKGSSRRRRTAWHPSRTSLATADTLCRFGQVRLATICH